MTGEAYNPAGWMARKLGCTCQGIANRWGEGCPVKGDDSVVDFVIDRNCPLHKELLEDASRNNSTLNRNGNTDTRLGAASEGTSGEP